jgi:hypothetical protein
VRQRKSVPGHPRDFRRPHDAPPPMPPSAGQGNALLVGRWALTCRRCRIAAMRRHPSHAQGAMAMRNATPGSPGCGAHRKAPRAPVCASRLRQFPAVRDHGATRVRRVPVTALPHGGRPCDRNSSKPSAQERQPFDVAVTGSQWRCRGTGGEDRTSEPGRRRTGGKPPGEGGREACKRTPWRRSHHAATPHRWPGHDQDPPVIGTSCRHPLAWPSRTTYSISSLAPF